MQIERQIDVHHDILIVVHHELHIAVLAVPLVEFFMKDRRIRLLIEPYHAEVLDLDEVVRVAVLRYHDSNAHDTAIIQLLTHPQDMILAILGDILAVVQPLFVKFCLDRLVCTISEPFFASAEAVKKSHTDNPPFNVRIIPMPVRAGGAPVRTVPSGFHEPAPQRASQSPSSQ